MIKKEKYNDYKNSLLNIARLTNKENSILINFKVSGNECMNEVNFIQRDGTKDLLENELFEVNEEFYSDFLEKFVCEYSDNMVVSFIDSIDMNEDGLYTYRIVTDDNDMLSIDGISLEYANYLTKLGKQNNKKNNENALVTWNIVSLLTIGIGLSFILFSLLIK